MYEHKMIRKPEDYFLELSNRPEKGVYFGRLNAFSEEIRQFIQKYYETARRTGVVIEGKIPNPDEKNLSYYGEMMGMDFRLDLQFITRSLQKWLPRMNTYQRDTVAGAIYGSLSSLLKSGKTENMIKNAYIKFMCWLYYKFERVVNQLGENTVPKILYEGEISNYELMLISILSNAGCDVVLLQYRGDAAYQKVDPGSKLSCEIKVESPVPFPEGYYLKKMRKELQERQNLELLYGPKPETMNCTNAWITGNPLEDILMAAPVRGDDPHLFYNCFIRITGVEDKLTYPNELYRFQLELKRTKRRLVILDGGIPKPTPDEISGVRRRNYTRTDQMLTDLSSNIRFAGSQELQRLMIKSFIDVLMGEEKLPGMNIHKLTNKGVYLLCWLNRYAPVLFKSFHMPEISCFIQMGGCRGEDDALFLRFLARLPVDVLILAPNLDRKCILADPLLFEKKYDVSLPMERFPQETGEVRIGTAAYHAERELDDILYQDSGIYRTRQHSKANAVVLQTMYEEIRILWKEEVKYRTSFSTVDGVVNIPVIYAKVCGVKDGDMLAYWHQIKELVTEDTFLIKNAPFIAAASPNPMKAHSTSFFHNKKLQKNKIRQLPNYPYAMLREEMQEHMFDKLQLMIDQKMIRGIGENGMEYTVVATVLNLPKEILRMIQKFDFTKKNPKLIYINTGETVISAEDAILTTFLSLLGFDVIFFVPTGYQCVEQHLNRNLMVEHQIGEFVYDQQVPDLNSLPSNKTKWRDLFKWGK